LSNNLDDYERRSDREWKNLNYDTRHGFWYSVRWVSAAIVFILVVIAVLWFAGVFTSDVRGAGDAHKTNQSGSNRIAKQEMFEQLYQDIQAADQRVTLYAQAKADDPSYTNKVNFTGAVTQCQQLVANYNAEARKYSSQDWRDNKLPSSIDQSDEKFDCKETK
jgi:nitrate/nitrite-specific signal transduction histidine kinase